MTCESSFYDAAKVQTIPHIEGKKVLRKACGNTKLNQMQEK